MKKITFSPVNWIFYTLIDLKNSTSYARIARSAVPRLFWALPKSEFGELASTTQASNNLWKREKKDCIGDFGSSLPDEFFFYVSISLFSQVPIRYRQRQTV